MVLAIRSQPGAWHRAWSPALLDAGREMPEVLAQSRRDLEDRHTSTHGTCRRGPCTAPAMTRAPAKPWRMPSRPAYAIPGFRARCRHRHRSPTCRQSCLLLLGSPSLPSAPFQLGIPQRSGRRQGHALRADLYR
jgi:hypothetical protein